MRQYRGKRVDNGEWVYGYFFKIWDSHYILWGTTNGVPNMIEVIPGTVGQATGLKDKDGVDIYEGDIIRYNESDFLEKVYWHNGGFKMKTINYKDAEDELTSDLRDPISHNLVVKTNIHENPELLEKN